MTRPLSIGILAALLLVLAVGLGACGKDAPPQSVSRVIYREPLAGVALPAAPAPLGPRPADARAQSRALLSKLCEAYAYIVQADPLLRLSAGLPAGAVVDYPECRKDDR